MSALLQFAQGIGSATFANPTTPGSTIIVAAANNDVVTSITTFTDDGGNLYTNSPSSHADANLTQTDIWFSYYSQFSPFQTTKSCQTVTESIGTGSPSFIWIFEVATNQLLGNSPTDRFGNVGPANAGYPGATVAPNLFGDFGNMTADDFCLTVCGVGGEGGAITAVDPTWTTIGSAQGGNWVAYRFAANGVDFFPNPTFSNSSATNFCISLTTFNAPPPTPGTGTIIVSKQTNPLGSPQVFTFRPSWEVPFTLTDGQSQTTLGLAPGTYSVSEDAVAGFTTSTNINPANIVLSSGQTINVVFTNTQLQPPCIPPDGSTTGTFVPDVGLFIGPSTSLYKDPVLAPAIKTYESTLEGRHEIILDFANGDGLYARDLGTIFSWSIGTKTALYVWQPSIIPMPETIYGRPSDWDDGGTPGAKFIQGIILRADSFGVSKTFQLESQDDHSFHNLLEMPMIFSQQQEKAFSCVPFISHAIRLMSSDGVRWRVWDGRLIYQPIPELTDNWQTEMTSLGMIGWVHAREMNIPHISTADISLTLTFDGWPSINLTIPNSGGLQAKTKVTLPPNKWKLIGLRALSAQPFRLFEGDLELKVKPWGSTESYNVLRPFGGPSQPGATV